MHVAATTWDCREMHMFGENHLENSGFRGLIPITVHLVGHGARYVASARLSLS